MVPLLVGVVPFGLVFGATAAGEGLSVAEVVGFSTVIFAGASQFATLDLLADGAPVLLAAATAWTINLRLLLYSASLAPYVADVPRRDRLLGGYLLTDQAYAVSLARFRDPTAPALDARGRWRFYLGAAVALWVTWQVTCVAGAAAGRGVPEDVPLDFAIPLVFLALLVPHLRHRPGIVAAVVGGVATVTLLEVGVGDLALFAGSLAGVAAGGVVGWRATP